MRLNWRDSRHGARGQHGRRDSCACWSRRISCSTSASLTYWSHWITPAREGKRFDTRFFAVEVPADQEASADLSELTQHAWLSEADARGGHTSQTETAAGPADARNAAGPLAQPRPSRQRRTRCCAPSSRARCRPSCRRSWRSGATTRSGAALGPRVCRGARRRSRLGWKVTRRTSRACRRDGRRGMPWAAVTAYPMTRQFRPSNRPATSSQRFPSRSKRERKPANAAYWRSSPGVRRIDSGLDRIADLASRCPWPDRPRPPPVFSAEACTAVTIEPACLAVLLAFFLAIAYALAMLVSACCAAFPACFTAFLAGAAICARPS